MMDVLIEVLEECAPRVVHPRADAFVHFILKPSESGLDLLRSPALLIDSEDPLLEVQAGLDRAEHFV